MAEIWFHVKGWQMYKVAPPSRVAKIGGRLQVIYTGKGYPDFMGCTVHTGPDWLDYGSPEFRACEVKEAKPCEGESVPASRLSVSQREFLSSLPDGTGHVFILWRDGTGEMFPFVPKGSYKKGLGNR